ncbi:penicillin-binding transpeptidase domain-containing protein [Vibrio harveyi]|nr:penicillin-binding transpeptidase domain-containing protein [Vibrio harveyi]
MVCAKTKSTTPKNSQTTYSTTHLFTAFAPYDKPKYVATVVIEHGNGGSKVGAPFIRNVFDHLLVHHDKDDSNKVKS